jgi:DNA (cytosine-5)-methyltransferase 1
MKVLDLFAGIGGFSLGLEKNKGFETGRFCEMDKHAQLILRKHWPKVEISSDVTKMSIKTGEFQVISGGFPCQDISFAGKQKGLKGERSGLWKEFLRLIKEGKPEYALIENVEHLKKKGLGVVLKDLFELGYDCEWYCLTGNSVGLPHQRRRIFAIAYPHRDLIDEKAQIVMPKSLYARLSSNLQKDDRNIMSLPRVVLDDLNKKDEKTRKERIKRLGNSIIPRISEIIGKAILTTGKEPLDLSDKAFEDITKLDDEVLHSKEFFEAGIIIKGKVYSMDSYSPKGDKTSTENFPTPVASDSINALGKNDTYKLTKNGRVRRYSQKGKNASLNLSRFVKFHHTGKLTLSELNEPLDKPLCPNFVEALMGYPEDWTKE